MEKYYKVVNLPKEPTRHHLGNFGLVLISEDLPQEICPAGFKAGLPYFEEIEKPAESVTTVEKPSAESVNVAEEVVSENDEPATVENDSSGKQTRKKS